MALRKEIEFVGRIFTTLLQILFASGLFTSSSKLKTEASKSGVAGKTLEFIAINLDRDATVVLFELRKRVVQRTFYLFFPVGGSRDATSHERGG